VHVAVVSVPALQDDVPDTVYPELHVGWQVDPLAREFVQSPAPPFVGGAEASHTLGSMEVHMFPPSTTAASLVPSLEDAMPRHCFVLPTEASSVQVAPESVEVQMFPPSTTAASLVPSLEDAMLAQDFVLPTEASTVQVAPESDEVQMFPPLTTAASLVPSLEEVTPHQYFEPPTEVSLVQVAPESDEV
jgi:hypothetical protein